jgi:hypothetical protein
VKHPRIFWAILLPMAGVSALAVWQLAPVLAPGPATTEDIARAFFAWCIASCAPEPVEHTAYVLAIAVPTLLMCAAILLLRRLRVLERQDREPLWVAAAGVVAQVALVGFGARAADYETAHYWASLPSPAVPVAMVTVLSVGGWLGLCWQPRSCKATWESLRPYLSKWPGLAWVVAGGWTLARLLPTVFTDQNVALAPPTHNYHLAFQMGEFAAVLNGRVPLLDFHPQYENLLGLLLRPVFGVTGFSFTTFSGAMAALSLTGMLLIYGVFVRVTGSSWIGLLLYVPWLGVSLASMEPADEVSTFSYHAVGPFRYFGLFVLAYAAVRYLAAPRFRRLAVVSCVAGFVALNNLDFGAPAAAGLWASALLFPPPGTSRIRQTLCASGVFVGGVALAFAGYWLVVRLSCGAWPHASALIEYQRTFAVLGFNMLPLPQVGVYWVVYATFILAVLYAVFVRFSESAAAFPYRRRLSTGMLAYGGVAGLGSAAYYVGRSHPAVLVTLYAAWAFVAALLAHRVLADVWAARSRGPERAYAIHAIPAAAILGLWCWFLPFVLGGPDVRAEIRRLVNAPAARGDTRRGQLVSLVAKYVPRGEPTVILYPDAHWLALEASVNNMCPFAHPDSVLLKAQSAPVLESIERLPRHRRYVFGRFIASVGDRLSREGFARIDANADFEVWTDSGSRTAAADR